MMTFIKGPFGNACLVSDVECTLYPLISGAYIQTSPVLGGLQNKTKTDNWTRDSKRVTVNSKAAHGLAFAP